MLRTWRRISISIANELVYLGRPTQRMDAGHGLSSVPHTCEKLRCSRLVTKWKCPFLASVSSYLCLLLLWPTYLGLTSRSLSPGTGWMSMKGWRPWSLAWPPLCPHCHSPTSSWWPMSPGPRVSFPPGAHLVMPQSSTSAGKERLQGGTRRGGMTNCFVSQLDRTVLFGI